jgi:5-(carboxyamino)imidazole ribonucleotide mutase
MGSDSDLPVVTGAIETLKGFGVEVEARVISAHRTPQRAADFAGGAANAGIEVIVAAAGKAAHLAGVLAAHTTLPVIGLPIKSSTLDGLDALLSTVQMPDGVPVATVAINGAKNAALLAVQMLSLRYGELSEKLFAYRQEMAAGVMKKDTALQEEVAKI